MRKWWRFRYEYAIGLARTLLSMLTMTAFGWGSGAKGNEKGALSERGAPFPMSGKPLRPGPTGWLLFAPTSSGDHTFGER